jgi:hypothetical protein
VNVNALFKTIADDLPEQKPPEIAPVNNFIKIENATETKKAMDRRNEA